MRTLLLALMICLSGQLQAKTFDHNHAQWTSLLERHVTWTRQGGASEVDYRGFKKDQEELGNYLTALSTVSLQQYGDWSRDQRLAFLINAYNAFTVKLVVDHYPVKSIKDIGGLFSSPWKQAFIPLLGRTLTLDQVEQSLIREPGVFDEPRIHFAVNCASIGCPALRTEAFVASELNAQFEDSQRRFLMDRNRNIFDPSSNSFHVSKIFQWYGDDFAKHWGSVEAYLHQHASLLAASKHLPKAESAHTIEFIDYDWSLNQPN